MTLVGRWFRRITLQAAAGFAVLGLHRLAAAEDERSACATAAEHAQQLRSEHKLKEARTELLVCVQPTCPGIVRNDCMTWLTDLELAIPSVVVKASGPAKEELLGVTMWIDGAQEFDKIDGLAHQVDPGVHHFRFEAEGMVPINQQIVIREGELRRLLEIQFARQPKLNLNTTPIVRPTPVLPYVLAGVGVAALGSFTYFGLTGRAEAGDLEDSCGRDKSCTEDQVDRVRTKLIVADVSLGISLASLGVATYLFVSHHRARTKEPVALQASAGPRSASISYQVAF